MVLSISIWWLFITFFSAAMVGEEDDGRCFSEAQISLEVEL
jgi:hypothetical protein